MSFLLVAMLSVAQPAECGGLFIDLPLLSIKIGTGDTQYRHPIYNRAPIYINPAYIAPIYRKPVYVPPRHITMDEYLAYKKARDRELAKMIRAEKARRKKAARAQGKIDAQRIFGGYHY